MKKVVVAMALVLGLGLSQANAQTNLRFGVKASANMSNYILKDMGNMESNMKVGANLGGLMKIEFGEYFAIQPEVMFNYRLSEMKNKSTGIKNNMEYWGMEIPVYAVGQLNLGNGKGYLGVGPYVGLGFSNKNTDADIDMYDTDAMHRWDFGWGAMLGYEFRNGIQINAGYQMGFINLVDNGIADSKMRTQTVSLGMAYKF